MIDSLEFFVMKNNEPVVTSAEAEAWLAEQVDRLIADHAWNGGWEEA